MPSDDTTTTESAEEESTIVAHVERLGTALANPQKYFVRRTERAAIHNRRTWRWEVSQQIEIPLTNGDPPQSDESRSLSVVLSLGIFSKSRLPDLRAFDASRSELPLLNREQRAEILSTLALGQFVHGPLSMDNENHRDLAFALKFYFERIIASSTAVAERYVDNLLSYLGRHSSSQVRAYVWDWTFLEGLVDLASTTHILCRASAQPGSEIILSHMFSDGILLEHAPDLDVRPVIPSDPYLELMGWLCRRSKFMEKTGKALVDRSLTLYGRLLAGLGLVSWTLTRANSNTDHCGSYHLILEVPDGCELSRAYWSDWTSRDQTSYDDARADEFECSDPVLSMHSMFAARLTSTRKAYFELRPARSLTIRTACATSLLLSIIGFYLSRSPAVSEQVRNSVVLTTSVPGYVAGLLAGIRSEFGVTLMRQVRGLVVLAATLGAVLGITVAFDWSVGLTRDLALGLTGVAVFVMLLLAFIGFRPPPHAASRENHPVQVRQDIRRRQWREKAAAGVFLPLAVAAAALVTVLAAVI